MSIAYTLCTSVIKTHIPDLSEPIRFIIPCFYNFAIYFSIALVLTDRFLANAAILISRLIFISSIIFTELFIGRCRITNILKTAWGTKLHKLLVDKWIKLLP